MARLTIKDFYGYWTIPLWDKDEKSINRQEIINKLAQYENLGYEPKELEKIINDLEQENLVILKDLHTQGVWLINPDGYYPYCSNCRAEPKSGEMSKFCPNCGSDMRRKEEIIDT